MPSNQPLHTKAKAQEPLNFTMIMIVVGLLLFTVWLSYSMGWFGPWTSNTEVEVNKVDAAQTIDLEKPKEDLLKLTQDTAKPANTATK